MNLSASMRQTPLFNVASMRLSYCCHSSMCSQNGFFEAANDFVETRGEAIAPPVHAGGPSTEAALPVLSPSAALDRPFALPKRQSVSSDASAHNPGT
jgi:hypothetical protein